MSSQPLSANPLVEALRARSESLHAQAMRLIREAKRFLEHTQSTFSSGTDHTYRHTTTVESIGRILLSDEFLSELNSEELFLFALACHYHDLAMAGTEADDRTPEARDQVRHDHAIRIGTIIREKWAELGFSDQRTAEVLGEVCRGHRPKRVEGEANWDELKPYEILGPHVVVRVRLLSALTYASDEMHLGHDRAPAKVQNWREMRDEESRRHWRRHRAVSGPARLPNGVIVFQLSADSPAFEENLRAQVFRKALSSLRDLARQAESDGISSPLPTVEVQWDRENMWKLLLPLACADLRPRSREEIEQGIIDLYNREIGSRTELTDFCTELGNSDEELRSSVSRWVNDSIAYQNVIIANNETAKKYVLSAEEAVASRLFARMREADELDRLFLGRYRASWEERLFESPYGRAYVAAVVLPAVDRSYSVQLTPRPQTDPLRVVLERCPTAARMASEFRPPPSNLVKETLLRQAAVTGAMFDLHNAPNRILDGTLRSALRTLTQPDPELRDDVRLIEELALIAGMTPEQMNAAHHVSDATREAFEQFLPGSTQGVKVTLKQSVPAEATSASTILPGLMLAGRRAGVPIQLAAIPGHDLRIQVTSDAGSPIQAEKSRIGIGPAQGELRGAGYLPARIELSKPSRTVRFYLGRFSAQAPSPYPFIVRLPAPPKPAGESVGSFVIRTLPPCLTVRDLRTIDGARQILRGREARVEFLHEDGGQLVASTTHTGRDVTGLGIWNAEALRGLKGIDGDLPAPLTFPTEDIIGLGRVSQSERMTRWTALGAASAQNRRDLFTLYLRILTETEIPVEEEFLTSSPSNLFNPPRVRPEEVDRQAELDRQWRSGEMDFRITAFFEPDVYELVRILREWVHNETIEFPFNFLFGDELVCTPLTRTAITVRFPPAIDRMWYRERPIIFEFRAMNRSERYNLEAAYWRSIGDESRVLLATEIRDRNLSERSTALAETRVAGDQLPQKVSENRS